MMSISMHLGHWLCCGPSYNLVCNMILVCEPIVDISIKDFFINVNRIIPNENFYNILVEQSIFFVFKFFTIFLLVF